MISGEAIFVLDLGAIPFNSWVLILSLLPLFNAAFLSVTDVNCSMTVRLYPSGSQRETEDVLETH